MILYINTCVRSDSRTNRLAKALLNKLGGTCIEVNPDKEHLQPLSEEKLDYRTKCIQEQDYSDPMFSYAKQFAAADEIVISAPFWDGSFPASLKIYLENIYVTGIVSIYGQDGVPIGLCKAKKLYYVTTAGGAYIPDFSYDYIRAIAMQCFGIQETELIKAEMMDIDGNDPEAILRQAIKDYGFVPEGSNSQTAAAEGETYSYSIQKQSEIHR